MRGSAHGSLWAASLALALAGCPEPSSIVPFPSDPCLHEGAVLEITPCNDDAYALTVCRDGRRQRLDCAAEETCVLGSEGTSTCGFNGQGVRTRRCVFAKVEALTLTLCPSGDPDPACAPRWGSYGACVGDDVCRNGVSQRVVCSDWAKTRQRTCIDGDWVDQACEAESPECEHGTTESLGCGGVGGSPADEAGRERACLLGRLSHATYCPNCTSGSSTERCGLNGEATVQLTCNDDGRWAGVCDGQDSCVSGATRPTACGLNGNGIQNQVCQIHEETADPFATFGNVGTCIDADECLDGQHRAVEEDCPVGQAYARCVHGQWLSLGCLPTCNPSRPCTFGHCTALEADSPVRVCLSASCRDGLENGDETATDYGGQSCGEDAEETACNGRDDDGDGAVDEGGAPQRSCGRGACQKAFTPVDPMDPCGPSTCRPGAPALEIPGNGEDEDCDGREDEQPVAQ